MLARIRVEPRSPPSLRREGSFHFGGSVMTFQDIILALQRYWADYGCLIEQPFDIEVGAGTMHPSTFFRSLGLGDWRVAYVQPARRPADGRYGENPNRLYKHYQYQVILKPSPEDPQGIYLDSLRVLGINPGRHDVRFLEDDWEAPTLGAAGVGWQVFLDGQEITQFTYFQQMGGIELPRISVELTYGLERIAMYVQRVASVFDLDWGHGVKYGDIRRADEAEQSEYSFQSANTELLKKTFDGFEQEALTQLQSGRIMPAYEYLLKCSHLFNLLEARGALGAAERTSLIARCRALSRGCAERYLSERVARPAGAVDA